MKKTISLMLVLALCMVAKADFTFGEPTNLGPTVNSMHSDGRQSMSVDSLTLFFTSNRPGGLGDVDIWMTTKQTSERIPEGYWSTPINLGSTVNSSAFDSCPNISADGLTLYFGSSRPGGSGGIDIWVTTRATVSDPWEKPTNLGPTVNSDAFDCDPSISPDGLTLYFSSARSGKSGSPDDFDIWVTTRATKNDSWGIPFNMGSTVNSSTQDDCPSISPDELVLFYMSRRSGSYGSADIWMTRRATKDNDWRTPVNLGPTVNSPEWDWMPDISADGCKLLITSLRGGGFGDDDIWQVPIIPIVDLNGDGIVDSGDMVIMVDNWGTDNSLCDIGPMPWGDGVVDVQDLIVLAEHLFEEVPPAEPVR
jgi:Tol biopolymer transport system component